MQKTVKNCLEHEYILKAGPLRFLIQVIDQF
jgi:hypothetical protein